MSIKLINSLNSVDEIRFQSQEYPKILVNKKLFQLSSQKNTLDTKTVKRQSNAGIRKTKVEVQNQSNLKGILFLNSDKKNNIETKIYSNISPELIEILNKYSNNEFGINPLSYAIYKKDYKAAIILL